MSNAGEKYGAARRGLGTLGLTLIVLLGWAAEQASQAGWSPAVLGQKCLGAAIITLIPIVGRIIDALPLEWRLPARGPVPSNPPVQPAQSPRLS
jgi:hypothetical protein